MSDEEEKSRQERSKENAPKLAIEDLACVVEGAKAIVDNIHHLISPSLMSHETEQRFLQEYKNEIWGRGRTLSLAGFVGVLELPTEDISQLGEPVIDYIRKIADFGTRVIKAVTENTQNFKSEELVALGGVNRAVSEIKSILPEKSPDLPQI